jgi:hypothetical protein
VGSISNRGRNYEPARLRSFCGQQNLKSHGVPRLIGGVCRCMAAHVQRLPRLTLKAGCKAGCRAGSGHQFRRWRRIIGLGSPHSGSSSRRLRSSIISAPCGLDNSMRKS